MTPRSYFQAALLLIVVSACLALTLVPASARPASAVVEAQSSPSLFVTVPPKVSPATYTMGDKIWTIRADRGVASTALLPAKATNISLPAGVVLTTSVPSLNGGSPQIKEYTIIRAMTLEKLGAEEISDYAAFIAPGVVVVNSLTAQEKEKAERDGGPHLKAPIQSQAPNCNEIHRAVKKYVTEHPERVLEVVALQIANNPDCACEVVKAAIIASEADTAMVVEIVEAAIEVAPSRFRIIGQCAIAVAPDSLGEVQAIINKYGAVSGDSGLGAKGGAKGYDSAKSAKGAKGGAGGDLGDSEQDAQPPTATGYQLPASELEDLMDFLDDVADTVVNPITIIGDFRTDSNNRIIPSSVRKRRVLPVQDVDVFVNFDDAPPPVASDIASQADEASSESEQDGVDEEDTRSGSNSAGVRVADNNGIGNGPALGASSDLGQGGAGFFADDSEGFQVIGHALNPGEFALPADGKISILEAIILAGGMDEEANEGECSLIRANEPNSKAILVNLRDIRSGKKPMVFVYAGDIVIIEQLPF